MRYLFSTLFCLILIGTVSAYDYTYTKDGKDYTIYTPSDEESKELVDKHNIHLINSPSGDIIYVDNTQEIKSAKDMNEFMLKYIVANNKIYVATGYKEVTKDQLDFILVHGQKKFGGKDFLPKKVADNISLDAKAFYLRNLYTGQLVYSHEGRNYVHNLLFKFWDIKAEDYLDHLETLEVKTLRGGDKS